MRVLIAEDYPDILSGIKQIFVEEGWEVETAEDGKIALDIYQSDPSFDMLVADYRMPHMMGDVFIRKALEFAREQGVKLPEIVILTGSNDGNLIPRAKAAGLAKILFKPGGFEELRVMAHRRMLLGAVA